MHVLMYLYQNKFFIIKGIIFTIIKKKYNYMKQIFKSYLRLRYFEKLIILFGILGLIPFIIGLIDLWYNYPNLVFEINIPKNYGVIIFTFLGSVYWGIMIEPKKTVQFSSKLKTLTIIYSISPSILGIIILAIQHNISMIILSIGFVISQIIDEFYNHILSLPRWYIILRRTLSSIVIIILICSYLIITK